MTAVMIGPIIGIRPNALVAPLPKNFIDARLTPLNAPRFKILLPTFPAPVFPILLPIAEIPLPANPLTPCHAPFARFPAAPRVIQLIA